ncbi:MAG TPA: hypothetical protein VN033_06900 [Vulgatibacter sp.]|nr:hypothetical protein [Vulgatibacter sp.]
MAIERLSVILAALLLVQLQTACRSEGGGDVPGRPVARASAVPAPGPAPEPGEGRTAAGDLPSSIAGLCDVLAEAGLAPTRIERLNSRQELPGCPAAELRYRLYVGDRGGFFNASIYASAADAQRCRNDFRAMALKGGESAWERLEKDVFVEGSWLILFPPDLPARDVRERILRAIGETAAR